MQLRTQRLMTLVFILFAGGFATDNSAQTTTAGSAPVKVRAPDRMLTNLAGMPVYQFDKDVAGKSNCNDACASKWPPLAASAGDIEGRVLNIITRDDGSKQWARFGKPLYLYSGDKPNGAPTGDKMGGVWHVVHVPVAQSQ
jgi:predicted lipoprotein with Yx(FWY)xxD motif